MVNIISSSGRATYGIQHYVVDEQADVSKVDPHACAIGSTIFVIATSKYYMLNSKKEWKNVDLGTSGGSGGGPGEGDIIVYEGGTV